MAIKTTARKAIAAPMFDGARQIAFDTIAPLAFGVALTRAELIGAISKTLGKAPTTAQVKAIKQEYVIGLMAVNLPAASLKACTTDGAKLNKARRLVIECAAPVEAGKTGRLPKNKTGRRNAAEQRGMRNAEQNWSQLVAEIGVGKAKTQGEHNAAKAKKTRAAHHNAAKSAAPSHSELVKPTGPMSKDEVHAELNRMSATMAAFTNKYAKQVRTSYSVPILAMRAAVMKAANEYAVEKTIAENAAKNKA